MSGSAVLRIVTILAFNAMTVIGVLVFGWPVANILLLFWVENALIGATTWWLLTKAPPQPGDEGFKMSGFFAMHYGIFCFVHLVFTVVTAAFLHIGWTIPTLLLPLALLLVRYGSEFLALRDAAGATSAGRAVFSAYARVITLHLTVILGFFFVISGEAGLVNSSAAVGVLAVLIGVKTLAEVAVVMVGSMPVEVSFNGKKVITDSRKDAS